MVTDYLGALEWSVMFLLPGFPSGPLSSPSGGSDPALCISCGGLIPPLQVSVSQLCAQEVLDWRPEPPLEAVPRLCRFSGEKRSHLPVKKFGSCPFVS